MIVSYLPVEYLDGLVAATGFNLGESNYEYKYKWLMERIRILGDQSKEVAILRDNPEKSQLVAVIQQERRWSAVLSNTITALQAEIEILKKEKI